MSDFAGPIVVGIGLFITLAIVAVVVGSNAQTSNVIKSSGSAIASIIQAAVAPVSGGSNGLNLNSNPLNTIVNGGFGSN